MKTTTNCVLSHHVSLTKTEWAWRAAPTHNDQWAVGQEDFLSHVGIEKESVVLKQTGEDKSVPGVGVGL